jgi:PAS domain S-box-containing protein
MGLSTSQPAADSQMLEFAKFEALAALCDEYLCVTEENGTLEYANSSFLKALGYEADELASLSIFQLTHPDDLERTRTAFGIGERDSPMPDFEHRCLDKSGNYRRLNWRTCYQPLSNCICAVGRPADAYDQGSETNSSQNVSFSQYAMDNAVDPVYWIDRRGRNVYINAAACDSLGYSHEEMLELSVPDYDPLFPQDNWDESFRKFASGELTNFETVHRRKDGREFPVELSLSVVEAEGDQFICAFVHDISERKRAVQLLTQFRFAADNSLDAVYMYGIDARIFYVNQSACNALGYSREELCNMTVFDLDPGLTEDAWTSDWLHRRAGNNQTLESRHRRKDGSMLPVEIAVSLTEIDGVEYSCAFVRDISERKESLRQMEQLNFAIDNAVDAVYIYTEDGVINYANKAACKSLGYSPEEVLRLTIFDLMPDDRHQYWREIWKQGRTGTFHSLTSKHRRKDGSYYPIEITFGVKEFEGSEYACAFVRDITERKTATRQMEELRLAVENAADAVYLYDANFKIYYANRAACEGLGYRLDELTGMAVYDLDANFRIADLEKLQALVRAKELKPFETLHRRKDGGLVPVEISAVKADFEGTEYSASFARDITDRKKVEAELREYREHLEELVKQRTAELESAQQALVRKEKLAVLGQLTGIVAHELRNPLGTIRSSLYLLKSNLQSQSNDVTRALARAERNIIRCDKIIGELLDYTRTRPLNPMPVTLSSWLNEVIEEYELPPEIEVETDFDPDIKVKIEPDRLRRCVINVLSNACDAMLEDGAHKPKLLRIQTRQNPGDIEVIIEDTGVGIPEGKLEDIFEPLYSTKGFGVGLGLAVVEQIMKQHMGSVAIASTEGEGTRVSLKLPLNANVDR